MDISRKHNKSSTTLRLSGECTIYHAASAKDVLLGDSKGFDKTVKLDLEQVSELDTAGVQLLMMLRKAIEQAGGTLQLQASNESVDQVLRTFQLPAPLQAREANS